MMERGGSARLSAYLLASAALAAAGAVWYRYESERRRAVRLARNAGLARAEADAAAERVFESTPETRFEDRDLRHRDAAKYD
jgi:hypothetical protein